MDIAKIRKKLKKAEGAEGHEGKQAEHKEKLEQQDTAVQEVPLVTEKTPDVKSGDRPKTEPMDKEESAEPALSRPEEQKPEEETEILAFQIADEEYAVRMTDLREIIRYQRITSVPCSPKYLVGVTSLRGKILPIVDLAIRLGLSGEKIDIEQQKIIILSGKKEPLGALVSSVLGVFRLPESELLPPPSTLTEEEKSFIDSVAKIKDAFISVLNIDEITKVEVG